MIDFALPLLLTSRKEKRKRKVEMIHKEESKKRLMGK
jgi:hypothetical protein